MRARLAAISAALLLSASAAQADGPSVVVSIKPLHSLVAGVTQGVSEPELLLAAGDSPHTYTMRPSEARAVRGADLIVRVSPHMETFLNQALAAHSGTRSVLTAAQLDGVEVLGPRQDRSQGAGAEHEHPGGHRRDYHLWLDPDNARAITTAVAERLAALDPAHADTYRDNAEAQRARIEALDERLRRRLEPVQDEPYVVFHDAYRYFERHYGLEAAGAVTPNPNQPPGAGHLQGLRERIRELGAVCVFSEPQFDPAIVRSLTNGLDARSGELDPLGTGLEAGPDAYFELLEGLADGFRACLLEAD